MKTKYFLVLLLSIVTSSIEIIYASNTQVNGIWYDFDSNTKTASVTYRGTSSSSYYNEYSGSVTIPSTVIYNSITYAVTKIGYGAFTQCSGLTSVTIPNSVTWIGNDAFSYCSGLTSITIPNSVTSMGADVFFRCTGLKSITLPNNITKINDDAFYGCSGLTSITIPNSVTIIGAAAFSGCSGLKVIACMSPNPSDCWTSQVFDGVSTSIPVIVPSEGISAYESATGWKVFNNYKSITKDQNSCSLTPLTLYFPILDNITRWEYSTDNGNTWNNINCKTYQYTENNPSAGIIKYRILKSNNTYSNVVTITYVDAVPSNIQTLPAATNTKTVGDTIIFTTDVTGSGYSYQWKKDGEDIPNAINYRHKVASMQTKHAGTYTCVVSNGCNAVTSTGARLIINKGTQNIIFPEISPLTYSNNLTYTLPQKTDKGLTILYQSMDASVATVSGNVLSIKAPGSVIITATQTGDVNYLEATPVSRTLVVNKRTQTITFDSIPEKTYEDLPFTLPQKTNEGLTISYTSTNTSVATVSGNTVTIKKPGTTEIIASQAGDATRYPATEVSQTLVVKKATQSITFGTLNNKTYGDAPVSLNEVSNKNLPIKYVSSDTTVASVNGNVVAIKKPGTTTITASQVGNAYYLAADPVSQSFTVNKANQSINFPSINSMPYGSADFALAEFTDKGEPITYVSSDTTIATIIGDRIVHIMGAGTTNISASQAGNDYFNPAPTITQALTVTKANQIINFPAIPVCTFGQDTFSLAATVNSGQEITFESSNEAVATVSGKVVTIVGAGQCFITASVAGNKNYYTATSVEQSLVVNKAQPIIDFTPIDGEHTYGDNPIILNASSNNGEVFFSSSDPSKLLIFGGNAIIQGAGSFTITASTNEDANHLAASASQGIIVNKADMTVSANNLSRVYGDANPELTYAISGLVNGDTNSDLTSTISISTTASSTSAVGTYEISPIATTDDNYTITCRKGVLTIEKAPLSISTQATREYGENNPDFEYIYIGFKNNETNEVLTTAPQAYTTAKKTSSVGTYPVYISGASASNYNITYETSSLVVEKAPLTITVLDATRKRLQPNPEFQLSISGYKLNDNISSLEQLPTIQCSADINSPAGIYPIVLLNDGHATNYSYILVNGTLTVEKLTYTITVSSQNTVMGTVSGSGTYEEDGNVTIIATPKQHYHFVSWNDGNTNATRTVTVSGDATYTASFAINQYSIVATTNGSSKGSVSGGGTYDYGTTITLTATPNQGYQFNRWSDGNTSNPRQVVVSDNKSYKAEFGLLQCNVSVSSSDNSKGRALGGGTFDYGTTITISASPNQGYQFNNWTDGNTDNPRQVLVTGNSSYIADFDIKQCVITTNSSDNSRGSVLGGGIYNYGITVELTAVPNEGFQFSHWADGSTDNPRRVVARDNVTYEAFFGIKQCVVTLNTSDYVMGRVFGGGTYNYGTYIELSAVPNSGYAFSHWSNGKTYNPYTMVIMDDLNLVAYFTDESLRPTEPTNHFFDEGSPLDSVVITTTGSTAQFVWPTIDGANSYSLVIWADEAHQQKICTLTFNTSGQLVNIDFSTNAPTRMHEQASNAETIQNVALAFTVTGLQSNSTYNFEMDAKNEQSAIIDHTEGSFATDDTDALDDIIGEPSLTTKKLLYDGKVYIIRGGKIYTVQGQEIKRELIFDKY